MTRNLLTYLGIPAAVICVIAAVSAFWVASAFAHDHARPDLDAYYRSLKVPENHSGFIKGWSCCNKRDCSPCPIKFTPTGIIAQGDNGVWRDVPPGALIRDKGNPYKFRAVICVQQGKIACAVLPAIGG